jgi:tRNA(fMet)-specific endonuclease VapC
MIHLDTNVAIALLNARPRHVRDRFDAARGEGVALFMSSVVLHELMFGAAASERRKGNEEKIMMLIASGIEILPSAASRSYLSMPKTPGMPVTFARI